METFAPYGQWDHVVHVVTLMDYEGRDAPWDMVANMDPDITYQQNAIRFVLTIDADTGESTLTVRHVMADPRSS